MTFAAQKEIGQKVYQEFARQKPGASQGEFHDFLKGHKDFDLLSGKLRQDIVERLRHQAMPVLQLNGLQGGPALFQRGATNHLVGTLCVVQRKDV